MGSTTVRSVFPMGLWNLLDNPYREKDVENGILGESERGTEAESRIKIIQSEGFNRIDSSLKMEEDTYAIEYMCKMIEAC